MREKVESILLWQSTTSQTIKELTEMTETLPKQVGIWKCEVLTHSCLEVYLTNVLLTCHIFENKSKKS